MSGHSKWSKIKRQKQAEDIKRGQIFTKLARAITLAAREGGGDPDMNFALRMAIDSAKEENMPKDNIERAIQRGMGKGDAGQDFEQVSYEAVGMDGISLIIDCVTDNSNRTVTEVRKVLEEHDFALSPGSAGWQFEIKGLIIIEPIKIVKADKYTEGKEQKQKQCNPEEVILEIMEISGVEDVKQQKIEKEGKQVVQINIITKKNALATITEALEAQNYKIVTAKVAKIAKNTLDIDDDTIRDMLQKLLHTLDSLDDTESVWMNVNL